MAIKAGNIIVGDEKVGATPTPSTAPEPVVKPAMKQSIARETKIVDTDPKVGKGKKKVSQYVDDMGAGNKINSLFD